MAIIKKQSGVSIIAAVFIIVILAFMGVMLVSILGGGTSASVNEMQSARALYIAEGGLEFALQAGTFCNYNVAATALGNGNFTVASQYIGPTGIGPATLNGNLLAGATAIPVNAPGTANYIIPGTIQIDSEYIHCTGTSGGNQFTGCTRGWAPPPGASAHNTGAAVTQCSVTSTGSVPTGFLVGTVSRTVQASVGP